MVGHLYYSTERSYQAVIIQINSGPKLLLKVSSIPSGFSVCEHTITFDDMYRQTQLDLGKRLCQRREIP